jgi:hypothetical protein
MRRLSIQPMAQPIVDAPTGARRILVRRFPYRLLYLLDKGRPESQGGGDRYPEPRAPR